MLSVTPFLWYDTQAEEAMHFYASIFPEAKVLAVHGPPGKAMSVEFSLQGQRFMALNAGPLYTFNEAVSFFVSCETQQEIDALWTKLTADGGTPGQCGWLKDKFGLSWQIIPTALGRLMGGGGDPARSKRVMQAMFTMQKLDVNGLQEAYDAS